MKRRLEEEEDQSSRFKFKDVYHETRQLAYEQGLEENEWIYEEDLLGGD